MWAKSRRRGHFELRECSVRRCTLDRSAGPSRENACNPFPPGKQLDRALWRGSPPSSSSEAPYHCRCLAAFAVRSAKIRFVPCRARRSIIKGQSFDDLVGVVTRLQQDGARHITHRIAVSNGPPGTALQSASASFRKSLPRVSHMPCTVQVKACASRSSPRCLPVVRFRDTWTRHLRDHHLHPVTVGSIYRFDRYILVSPGSFGIPCASRP